MFFVLNPP